MALSKTTKPYYSREEFAEILKECGFKASFFCQAGLFPQIESGVVGHKFIVTLSGRSLEHNRNNIMTEALLELSATKKTTPRRVNEWNRNFKIINERNFVTASCHLFSEEKFGFLDASLVIALEHTSPANIAIQIERWNEEVSKILSECTFD